MRFRIWNNGHSHIYDLKGDAAEMLAVLAEHGTMIACSRARAALLDLRKTGLVPVVINERREPGGSLPVLSLETAVEAIPDYFPA